MKKIVNMCCDCAVPGYPCLGSICPNRNVEVHYCDRCGAELAGDEKGENGREYCEECYEDLFGKEED